MALYEESQPGNEEARPRSSQSENPAFRELEKFNLQEKTFADSSYWDASQRKPYNPDDLVQRRHDYSIYEEMLNDDQISVCLQLKKDLVLASGFEIITEAENDDNDASDDDSGAEKTSDGIPEQPEQESVKPTYALEPGMGKPDMQEIQHELETGLQEAPEIDFETSLEEILSAYEFGFSVTEKVFQIKEDGYACLRFLKTRHPVSWLLHTDDRGNITRFEQRGPTGSIDAEAKTLIHYVNNPRFGNVYGRSDLRAAYNAWFIKREIVKYYAIFLEKAASPTPVARYDKNAPQAAVDQIFEAIKKLQTKTALAIPKDIEMEFLEAKNAGEVYVKGINLFNMFIGRSLLIPDLLGFQGAETGGGSYALGKDQIAVLFKHVHKRRTTLEKIINREVIRPLVLYNYGNVENFPKFRLKPINDEQAVELAKLWVEATKGKLYKPNDEEINYFRRLCKFPEGIVEREEPPAPLLAPGFGAKSEGDAPAEIMPKSPQEKETPAAEKKEEFKADYKPTPGDYSKKVNFRLIKTTMETAAAKVLESAKPIFALIYADLSNQVRDKKIIQSQDIAKVDAIKVKYLAKLKKLLKEKFYEMHKDARRQAQGELINGAQFAEPLPNEDFLKFLEEETFQYIADYEYQVKKKLRLALIQGIKDGTSLSDVIRQANEDGLALSEESIERFARTKFTEVMNRGRKEFFEESGVVAAYQYSAILDSRTSEICDGLHGKIFEKDDAPTPPLHFNCRSVLIPITKYEDYKADKTIDAGGKTQSIDKFIEDNIGEGFAKYTKAGRTFEPNIPRKERIPEITDPDVTYSLVSGETTDVYTYRTGDGREFYKITVSYKDARKETETGVERVRIPIPRDPEITDPDVSFTLIPGETTDTYVYKTAEGKEFYRVRVIYSDHLKETRTAVERERIPLEARV